MSGSVRLADLRQVLAAFERLGVRYACGIDGDGCSWCGGTVRPQDRADAEVLRDTLGLED